MAYVSNTMNIKYYSEKYSKLSKIKNYIFIYCLYIGIYNMHVVFWQLIETWPKKSSNCILATLQVSFINSSWLI